MPSPQGALWTPCFSPSNLSPSCSALHFLRLTPVSPPGLSTEGIYRVRRNKSEMESLQRQFDQGKATATQGRHHCRWSPWGAPATQPQSQGCWMGG